MQINKDHKGWSKVAAPKDALISWSGLCRRQGGGDKEEGEGVGWDLRYVAELVLYHSVNQHLEMLVYSMHKASTKLRV